MWLQWHWKPNIWCQSVSAMEGENVWVWSWSQTENGHSDPGDTKRTCVRQTPSTLCLSLAPISFLIYLFCPSYILCFYANSTCEQEQIVKSRGGGGGGLVWFPTLPSLAFCLSLATPSHNRVWVSGSSQKPLSWWQVLSVFRPSGISEHCIFER